MITPNEFKIPEILPDDNRKSKPQVGINLYFYTPSQLMTYYECRKLYYQKSSSKRNYNDFLNTLRAEFKKRFNCNIYGESLCNDSEDDD